MSATIDDEDLLGQMVEALDLLASGITGVDIVVRPTCVDPEISRELKARLRDIAVGVPNGRHVHPLSGQLVIVGPAEAHRRIASALAADEYFLRLDPSLQAGAVLYLEGRRPRRR